MSTAPQALRLPDWGPYSKRYAGISHVADPSRGARVDFTIVPGFFRGNMVIPDGLRPSGFHPWQAAPGLSHYTYRYQLEWKDRIYCDVSFTELTEQARLVTCEYVNHTGVAHRVVTHAVSSLDFARIGPHSGWLRTARLEHPPGVVWRDGLDYRDLTFARRRPDEGLVADGLLAGEARAHDSVGGSVLGDGFGRDVGDRVSYDVGLEGGLVDAVMRLRYRLPVGLAADVVLDGLVHRVLHLSGSGAMCTVDVDLGALPAGQHRLILTVGEGRDESEAGAAGAGGPEVQIDGLALGEREDVAQVRFGQDRQDTDVATTPGPDESLLVEHATLPHVYGFSWSGHRALTREFVGDDLDMLLRGAKYDRHGVPAQSSVGDPERGETTRFTDVLTGPVLLAPRSRVIVHGFVCHGQPQDVSAQLEAFARLDTDQRVHKQVEGSRRVVDLAPNPAGQRHVQAQQRTAATVLTNIVYPTYLRRGHVKHFTPGTWWDSLYTWDSGLIGLGLLEVDPPRAQDCLRMYLTGPDDQHSAFIHHGTPVPTQQYLAAEILNRSPDPDGAADSYPGLREQYRYLAGRHPASRTRLPSGLLNTFAHFYNSGGWDDYPAQVFVHANGLSSSVAPMATVSHAIRVAKLLLLADSVLSTDAEPDTAHYRADIADMTSALQQCWDPETGYFGYATHDEDGSVSGILRDGDAVNLNMGLDGVYPLVAGVCDREQTAALLERLFSSHRLWTEYGISAVDQSAPYFSLDGYWNGSVWIAHQWFLFKTMLDLGRPDLAHRIASTALDTWTAESDRTYNCWEHFSIATGRGAGWHQFGGLSSPVLNFYAAYHRPGNVTAGLDTLTVRRAFSADKTALSTDLISLSTAADDSAVIACMAPGHTYRAWLDGSPVRAEAIDDGVLHISWPAATGDPDSSTLRRQKLVVQPA